MDVGDLFKQLWPYAIVAAPGLWAVWKQLSSGQAASRKERIDLVRLAEEVSANAIKELREDNAALRGRLDEIEEEFAAFRRTHDGMIADKDAELALIRGENRQLKALLEAYERLLEANGIPHEKPMQPYWRVAAGEKPVELLPP